MPNRTIYIHYIIGVLNWLTKALADKSIGDVLPADDWNQLIENNRQPTQQG